jgi:hypothetical protein
MDLPSVINLNGIEPETTDENQILQRIETYLCKAAAMIAYAKSQPGDFQLHAYQIRVNCRVNDSGQVEVESIGFGPVLD